MASTFTVQSLFYQTPSLELLRRPTQSSSPTSFSLPLVSLRPSASGCGVRGGGRSFVHCSAIATPNNILTEEAFKNLGRGFSSDDEEEELLRDSEEEGDVSGADKEELAVSRLGLPQRLVQSLEKRGITHLFPIQRAVLLPALEGQDIIARAKTGTGKTLAFGIPILKRLTEEDDVATSTRRGRLPRVLVLAPTRELANQVEKEIKESAPYLSTVCVYGGVSYVTQQNALTRGVDVVVGTPGRIIDLIKSNSLKLGEVEFLVLDEADQMLAVGFEEDVETILQKLPSQRQSMLFSATMPGWVNKLSRKYLNNPLTIDLVGDQDEKLAEGIKLYALSATSTSKRTLLNDLITVYAKGGKTIVFTQTKRDADEVSLALSNTIASEALHGDISQHQRERTLNGFRQGKFTVLVATDVAARGLDIPNVDLIIHYELPNDPETFVHRSGRTGRAGKEGKAILMYTNSQRRTVRSLERDVGCKFEYISAPGMQDVLESSAAQVVAALKAVHSESVEFFTPTAERLIKEEGVKAFAAALAHLSGFSKPPSSRSLLTHEQGWVTFQLTRDQAYTRGYLSARSVTGFLSDVFPAAADAVGKIHMVADQTVQAAVFDVPEEIAKELLNKEIPIGNTITKLSKLPPMQDDGPAGDFYGKFGGRERSGGRSSSFSRRGGGGGGGGGYGRSSSSSSFSRGGGGWGSGRDSNDDYGEDSYRRGGGGGGGGGGRGRRSSESSSGSSSWSRASRSSGDDWLIGGGGGRSSSRPFSSRDRGGSFGGACFVCGKSGHKASDCPGN